MKKRLLSVLAFALAVSAGAAFVLYQLISSRVKVGAATRPVTVRVFVASHDLPLGALLQERDVVTKDYLAAPGGAILKKDDIIGRGVTSPIHEDSPFYDNSLAPKGGGAGFAVTIPLGMRAFAVHVNEVVGVAGFAVPGMRVDVLVSGTPVGNGTVTTAGAVTRTLLQNIEVLSAGQNFQKDAEGKPVLVQVVNLLVTPDQAEVLNLATEERIQLVLRNPTDKEIVETHGATTRGLFTGVQSGDIAPVTTARAPRVQPAAAPAPPPAPKAPELVTIEVISGDHRAQAVFKNPDSAPKGNTQ